MPAIRHFTENAARRAAFSVDDRRELFAARLSFF
jgi:hypothetical protein